MCGEHISVSGFAPAVMGSSPHVRGAHNLTVDSVQNIGIIPACAGSTGSSPASTSSTRDHPRMCGEHQYAPIRRLRKTGSSPHVRGAQWVGSHAKYGVGIIPACAGSTGIIRLGRARAGDHPRMCGEHRLVPSLCSTHAGSSPHVRGARLSRSHAALGRRDHPRMCGEHRFALKACSKLQGSSPHVRGAPCA